MDEIIPADSVMPAAGEVGAEYLSRFASADPQIRGELIRGIGAVSETSKKLLQRDFISLSNVDRVQVLQALERERPETFATLRDYVYESYYVQPRIWKLMRYEFYPANQSGPVMAPFDDTVLANVRKKPPCFRNV
jgi:hypothetical protein